MKKIAVALISVILTALFGLLVYYGLTHSRGAPTKIEKAQRIILDAPFIAKEVDLKNGIAEDIWSGLPQKEIKLMYQVMVLPWPKAVTPALYVKAFHNQKEVYFYISWKDETPDTILGLNRFSDACAILFPLGKEAQPASVMMGFMGRANIWQWKASQDREFWQAAQPETGAYADYYYPFEEQETLIVSKTVPKSAANDLIAIRAGTITPLSEHNIEARGVYSDGTWRVVFKRPIEPFNPEEDAIFNIGEKRLCGFAAWNGSNGDRGGRKSISDWVELVIK